MFVLLLCYVYVMLYIINMYISCLKLIHRIQIQVNSFLYGFIMNLLSSMHVLYLRTNILESSHS